MSDRRLPALHRILLSLGLAVALIVALPRPARAAQPTARADAAAIIAAARALIGSPYAYIGDDPSTGFSCIGFIHYIFAGAGIDVPYDLNAAYAAGPRIAVRDLQPGDLVFFAGTLWNGLSHVALYAGDDEIIGADTYATGVEMTHFSDPYWAAHYIGATRPLTVLAVAPSPPPPPPSPAPLPQAPPRPAVPAPVFHPGQLLSGRATGVVYTGPGYSYGQIDRLLPRVTVQVVRVQGTWTNVVYRGAGTDDYGWVDARYVGSCAAVPESAPRRRSSPKRPTVVHVATVTAGVLLLRRGPSRDRPVLARLRYGRRVRVLTAQGAWDRVLDGRLTGWVFARWLNVT